MRSAAGAIAATKKIVLLGAASTGKTSIVNRFAHNRAASQTESTIGAAFLSKVVRVHDQDVKLEIWDTGGSEKYRAIAPMYYRDCNGAVIVFDVTMESSLSDAKVWLEELQEKGPPSAVVACAANKIDLEVDRAIDDDKINKFLLDHSIGLGKKTSAVTGQNINELFAELAELMMVGHEMVGVGRSALQESPPPEKSGCC
jgi:Ras-related protein Rab-5C